MYINQKHINFLIKRAYIGFIFLIIASAPFEALMIFLVFFLDGMQVEAGLLGKCAFIASLLLYDIILIGLYHYYFHSIILTADKDKDKDQIIIRCLKKSYTIPRNDIISITSGIFGLSLIINIHAKNNRNLKLHIYKSYRNRMGIYENNDNINYEYLIELTGKEIT